MEWFESLELWAKILIIAGVIIVGLWLLTLIVTMVFALIFKKRLKNDSNAINLLLVQRFESMKDFITLCNNYNVELPKDDVKNIELLERISDFQKLTKEDRDNRVLTFMHSAYNIVSICNHSKKVSQDELYAGKMVEFNDIEDTYRQKTALYNADILGFNYWVGVLPVKFIFLIFKLKKRDLIV